MRPRTKSVTKHSFYAEIVTKIKKRKSERKDTKTKMMSNTDPTQNRG